MIYSKDNPSPEYTSLIKDYEELHKNGAANLPSKDTYNGRSTIIFADILKKVIDKNKCETLLDYGSGKGDRYYKESIGPDKLKTYPPLKDFWNIKPTLYDPGVPYPKPTDKKFDIVISIDVLEHVPNQDLRWVIDEIFNFSKKIVFLNIACYPAIAKLKNNKNAHTSIFPPNWWYGFISAIALNHNKKIFLICTTKEKSDIKKVNYSSFVINDNFNNYK